MKLRRRDEDQVVTLMIDPFAPEVRPAQGAYIVVYDASGVVLASGIYDGDWNLHKGFTNAWSVRLPATAAGKAIRVAMFARETRQLMSEGPLVPPVDLLPGGAIHFAAGTLMIECLGTPRAVGR